MNIEYDDIDDDFFCAKNLHDDLDVGRFELDNNGWGVATHLWQVRPRERWENGQYDQYYWCLEMLMVRMMVIYIMTTLTLTWCLLIFWFVTVSSGRKNPFGSLCCYFGGDPLCCWKSHRIIVVIIIIIVFIVIVIIAMIMINRVTLFGKSRSLRAWSRKSSRLILEGL